MVSLVTGASTPTSAAIIYSFNGANTAGTITVTTAGSAATVTNNGSNPTTLQFIPSGFQNILVGSTIASNTASFVVANPLINSPYNFGNNPGSVSMTYTAQTGVTLNLTNGQLGGGGNANTQTVTITGAAAVTQRGAQSVGSFTASGWAKGVTGYGSSTTPDVTSVSLAYKGVAPIASITAVPSAYLLAGSATSATRTFTITNTGDGNLHTVAGAAANLSSAANTFTTNTGWSTTTATFTNSTSLTGDGTTQGSWTAAARFTYASQASRQTNTATITSSFSNGSADGTNKATVLSTQFTGVTVAPVASIASTISVITARAGTTGVGANSMTIKNIGDASATLGVNLTGTVSASSPDLTGGGAVNLADGASQTYSFNYAPTVRQSITATITAALTNGSSDGKNNAANATASVALTAVGPDYRAALNTVGNTINDGATVSFGDAASGVTKQTLLISNISNDNASAALTNMTITASIIGDPASEFSFSLPSGFQLPTFTTGVLRNIINGADLGSLAVQFVSKTGGTASAQLRIQTDEESALGVMGSSIYVYNLIGTVPEPGTLMVLGVGMLGLAISRRNRRGKTEAVALMAQSADETEI